MNEYRVQFADGTTEKVHADDRWQAEEAAIVKRKNSGQGGPALEVVGVIGSAE